MYFLIQEIMSKVNGIKLLRNCFLVIFLKFLKVPNIVDKGGIII